MEVDQQKFNFQDTEATQRIFSLRKRIRAVCGGTSASKTISILIWLIDYAQSCKNKKIDVMSESYPHLEDGAIKDFKSIMLDRGYWNDDRWNESKHVYSFETGSVIKFISIDKLGKAHGPRRDVLFINEANNISYHIYDQLAIRTKEVIWLDWNPSSEFWFYSEVKNKFDHDFITLTYKDCLNVLDQRIVDSIESHKDNKNWWKVYGLGQLGEVEGKIYKGWKIIDEIPHEARLIRRGLDFGYSNDPTAVVDIYKYNNGYILDELLFQKGMSNQQIADTLKNFDQAVLTIADSAEPKSIDELKAYGINVIGATKGRDSVRQGIQFIQDKRISVTKRSINVIKEYRNYLWKVDRNSGIIMNEPEHAFSHSMDCVRYGFDGLDDLPRLPKSSGVLQKQIKRSRNSAVIY
uniref:Putative terminase n=1 Tax=viral metagenome TaxID=1070528 RepID=A0A6M3Y3I9_9ZZZZ